MDDGKAAFTVSQIMNHLVQLHADIIDNRNIDARKLCNKGLQLNVTGTNPVLKNLFWSLAKIFEKVKGCLGIINDEKLKSKHPSVFDSGVPIAVNNREDQPENRNLNTLIRRYFQNASTVKIGISDFHKLVVTLLKCSMKTKVENYLIQIL